MKSNVKDNLTFFLIGVAIGVVVAVWGGLKIYAAVKGDSALPTWAKMGGKSGKTAKGKFFLSFEAQNDLKAIKTEGATVEISDTQPTHGDKSLLVNLSAETSYPGLVWEVFGGEVQNWKGAKQLHLDVYNNTEDYVSLKLKFKSGRNYPKKTFEEYPVEVGPLKMNKINVPLEKIGEQCDLSEMSYFKIFVKEPASPLTFYIDNIKVE
jgi:hypothetical protein